MPSNDVLTRNSDGDLSVRVVSATEGQVVNQNDVYTRDTDGNLCVRTVGGSGGGSSIINDNSTSLTETWSAHKLNTMIGDVETLLSQI